MSITSNNLPWFENWFDSPYYHILYKHRNVREAQLFLDKLLATLQPDPGSGVLDLACGKGRHALYLNQKGFDVTGVDLSERNIAHARQFENKRLAFSVHDMRDALDESRYDIVLNLFTSFGYFEDETDNEQVIRSVERALKPDGLFVMDFMNAKKTMEHLVEHETQQVDGIVFHLTRSVEEQCIVKRIRFRDKQQEFSFEESVRAYTLKDFEAMFASNGLKIRHVYGDYRLKPFDEKRSDRLVVVAGKTAISG